MEVEESRRAARGGRPKTIEEGGGRGVQEAMEVEESRRAARGGRPETRQEGGRWRGAAEGCSRGVYQRGVPEEGRKERMSRRIKSENPNQRFGKYMKFWKI